MKALKTSNNTKEKNKWLAVLCIASAVFLSSCNGEPSTADSSAIITSTTTQPCFSDSINATVTAAVDKTIVVSSETDVKTDDTAVTSANTVSSVPTSADPGGEVVTEVTSVSYQSVYSSEITDSGIEDVKRGGYMTCQADIPDGCAEHLNALDELIESYPYMCGIYIRDIENNMVFEYNSDGYISGASTIKLIYAYYCCTLLESENASFEDTVEYRAQHMYGGAGVVKESAVGTMFTVRELMDFMLRYSDNTAYLMLLDHFGMSGFNTMMNDMGYSIYLSDSSKFPVLNAKILSDFMFRIYSQEGELWEAVMNSLNNSEYSYVRSILGDSCTVASKYGFTTGAYHEVTLIDNGSPYILTIMTGTYGNGYDRDFVKGITENADMHIEAYRK